MPRELTPQEFRKFRYITSKNLVIEDVREEGTRLGVRLKKAPLLPDDDDLAWFWRDANTDAIEITNAVLDSLATQELVDYYPYPTLKWASAFYKYIIDPLENKEENTGIFDYLLFFTLLYPLPNLPKSPPLYQVIEVLIDLKTRVLKNSLPRHILEKDPETLQKLINWETIDWKYTSLMSYQTLRKRVIDAFTRTPTFKTLHKQLTKNSP